MNSSNREDVLGAILANMRWLEHYVEKLSGVGQEKWML